MSETDEVAVTVTDDLGQHTGGTATLTLHDPPSDVRVSPADLPAAGGRLTIEATSDRPLTFEATATAGTLTPVDGEPGAYDYTPA